MREITSAEFAQVAGAGVTTCDIVDTVESGISTEDVGGFVTSVYEGLVQGVGYIIGRVAGDLDPSYYE